MVIQRHDVVGTCDSDPIELILHRRLHHHRMTYRRRRLHFSATNDDDVDFRSSVDWTNYYCRRRHRHLPDIDDESFVVVAVVAVVVVWKRVSHAYYYSHSRGGPDSISESTMIYGGSRRFHGSLVVVVGC